VIVCLINGKKPNWGRKGPGLDIWAKRKEVTRNLFRRLWKIDL